MSQHFVSVSQIPAGGEQFDLARVARLRAVLRLVALVGGALSLLFFFLGGDWISATSAFNGEEVHYSIRSIYSYSWLFAFVVCFTLCLGSLFWVLLHHASNSSWGVAIRRIPEVVATQILLIGVLGVPLLLVPPIRETLWTWMHEHAQAFREGYGGSSVREYLHEHGHHLLHHKYGFLSLYWGVIPGWVPRYVIYFVLLGFGAFVLRRWSVMQDDSGDLRPTFWARRFSCGWLPVFALSLTFASFDWVKSLNYTWFSTMFGVNFFAGSAMGSMALLLIIVVSLKELGYLKRVVTEEHFHLMGKLMHVFVIFWAYIAFSQYFLIWYANIAEETQFYAIRNTEGWCWYSILLITIGHFFLPFVLLLVRANKKRPKVILGISAWVLFAHLCEIYWFIIPERGPKLADRPSIGWAVLFDVIALATMLSVAALAFLHSLSKQSLYPCGDPRLQESINVVN
ncbi:MAG: hypothetical protein ACR2OZ_19960 [Verrucomicrobiales bacterium]